MGGGFSFQNHLLSEAIKFVLCIIVITLKLCSNLACQLTLIGCFLQKAGQQKSTMTMRAYNNILAMSQVQSVLNL
jgi:hypothetical protein